MKMLLTTAALAALCSTAVFAADAAAGKDVYAKSCKSCHGPDGVPPAGMAKAMGIKDMTTTAYTADQVKTAVTAGKGKMKPIPAVTGASVDNVAAYVLTLKK